MTRLWTPRTTRERAMTAALASPGGGRSPYYAAVLADNPIGFWPLDEAAGLTAFDLVGGNHGTYSGGVALGSTPLVPGITSADFNGATARLDIPDAANLSIITTGRMSWEWWWSRDALGGEYALAFKGGTGYEYLVSLRGAIGNTFIIVWSLPGVVLANFGVALADDINTRHHQVVTVEQGSFTIYIDGASLGNGAETLVGIGAGADNLNVGVRGDGPSNFMNGRMGLHAVYDYVLPPARVAAHWTAGQ